MDSEQGLKLDLRDIFKRILGIIVFGHVLACAALADEDKLLLDFPRLLSSGNKIVSSGRGTFTYGPWTMDADDMTYDRASKQVHLSGNVVVEGLGLTLNTLFVEYNLGSKIGTTGSLSGQYVSKHQVYSPNPIEEEFLYPQEEKASSQVLSEDALYRVAYFKAHHADLCPNSLGEPELVLRSTVVSDCNQDPPHHDFFAGKLRWSKDQTVEAQHIVPHLFGVPYFYLPFAARDLSHDWPWTRWTLGSQSNWGRFFTFETKLIPDKTNDDLKLIVGAREHRGSSLGLEWDYLEGEHRQNLHLNYWQERWVEDGFVLEDDRWRLDWLERYALSAQWDFSLDVHVLDPQKSGLWRSGNAQVLNRDLYASPFGANVLSVQERDGLVKDYDKEQWERGRLLENELSLDYHSHGRYLSLKSLEPSDGEQLRSRFKHGEVRGHVLPESLGMGWLWSGEAGLGYQGERLGWQLSDADLQTLGLRNRNHFETWRADVLMRIEREEHFGALNVRPWIGERTLAYGDVLKDSSTTKEFYNLDEQLDLDGSMWAPRLLAGLEFDTVATGTYLNGGLAHQFRPSLQFLFAGPSSLSQDQVVTEVDEIDLEQRPRFELVWGVQNEILKGQGGARRLLYTQALSWGQLFREADRNELFGVNHLEGTDIRFHQAFYPMSNFNFYNELKINSFHAQVPWIKAGFQLHKDGHQVQYGFNYRKDLLIPTDISHRHDIAYSYKSRWDDVSLQMSWDGDQQNSTTLKSDEFYQKGFRRFDIVWGHLFHCLRTEMEFEYDFEDSGATFIFRFGPDFFRESLPHYREGLHGL